MRRWRGNGLPIRDMLPAMPVLKSDVRRGAYCDSIVLMQLQSALQGLDGVADCGAVMATDANLALLESNGLRPPDVDAGPDDLLVVVAADAADAADAALAQVDQLLARRRGRSSEGYRPRSLEAAVRALPDARWVLVSVPGRYARTVAEKALELGRHVFLYSDNVPMADEAELKRRAHDKGLLVMGPDCGTAIVGGVGLGFANRVRRGDIGLVGASGTGLQAVTSRIHGLGGGVSHALGTGGRDLHAEIGAVTALQGLDLLARDPRTRVIVLISKPPAPAVAARLLAAARQTEKPVVVDFLGYPPPSRHVGALYFASGLGEAAEIAMELSMASEDSRTLELYRRGDGGGRCLRGLFAGGTLAYEALQGLRAFLAPMASNIAMDGVERLDDPTTSRGHTIVDLGDDALTVGRLHPMIDPDLGLRRLRREAEDPDTGLVLVDVVLGHGAHPDPAGELAPVIEAVRGERPELGVVALVVGTDEDPQDLGEQIERLERAGARVVRHLPDAIDHIVRRLTPPPTAPPPGAVAVPLDDLDAPFAAVNVGLESFHDSLAAQDAAAVHVDWRPPAGGDARLMALLERMR